MIYIYIYTTKHFREIDSVTCDQSCQETATGLTFIPYEEMSLRNLAYVLRRLLPGELILFFYTLVAFICYCLRKEIKLNYSMSLPVQNEKKSSKIYFFFFFFIQESFNLYMLFIQS